MTNGQNALCSIYILERCRTVTNGQNALSSIYILERCRTVTNGQKTVVWYSCVWGRDMVCCLIVTVTVIV